VVPAHVARGHHADRAGHSRFSKPAIEQRERIDAERQVGVAHLEPRDDLAFGQARPVERPAEDALARGEARHEEGLRAGRPEERFHLRRSDGSARGHAQAPSRVAT